MKPSERIEDIAGNKPEWWSDHTSDLRSLEIKVDAIIQYLDEKHAISHGGACTDACH